MLKRRRLVGWIVIAAMIAQSFGLITASAADSALTGLVFDPARQNSVELEKVLDNVPATFEMIAKFEPDPGQRQILFGNYRSGAATQFSVELTAANRFRYYELSNGVLKDRTAPADTTPVTTGEWIHLAVTRDAANGKVTLILDGAVAAEFENLDLPDNVEMHSLHSIGTDPRNTMHIRAEVKEVRLWSDVRTLDELRDDAYTELQGNEAGLMHAWALDSFDPEGGTNAVPDKVGAINGVAKGFGPPEPPYQGEFTGEGADFASGLDVATMKTLGDAPRTVEAWLNVPADTPSGQRVGVILGNYWEASYGDIPQFNFEIYSSGAPRIYWTGLKNNLLDYRAATVNVNRGDWIHVAIVLDEENNTAATYINGEKAHEETLTIPTLPVNTGRELKIGSDYRYDAAGKPSMAFKGEIADVRVWSTARTAEEIQANYNTLLQGNEAGLLGNWQLDQLTDGVYADSSAQQNNGYLHDGAVHDWLAPDFPEGDYTIAVIPDTQYMTRLHPEAMKDYFKWMRDRADELNIKLAISVGDIVDTPRETREWEVAAEAYSYLDGVIPYTLVPGNHDVVLNRTTLERDYSNYNTYFPYSKYSQEPTFGGAFEEGKMENTYHFFDIGDVDYMLVALEFGPTAEVLEWANEIVAAHPDKRVIFTTHSYMYHNGEQIGTDHIDYPSQYIGDAKNGDDMWNEFVSKHDNIVLVLSGHIGYPDLVVREDLGEHGNAVKQVLADAQFMSPRDIGMIMLMTFKEGSNDVEVNWYSVKNDRFYLEKNQFTMTLNLYPDGGGNPGPEPEAIRLSAADRTVNKGDVFTVPLTLEGASKLVGIEGVVQYDAEWLTLESFVFETFGETGASNTAIPGRIGFAGVSDAPVGTDESTVLANLTFRANADLTSDSQAAITFSHVQGAALDAAEQTVYATIVTTDASIAISGKKKGDFNGDGKVDVLDAVYLLKLIVAGRNEDNEAEWAEADINGDNAVDTLDVLVLLHMIADELAEIDAP